MKSNFKHQRTDMEWFRRRIRHWANENLRDFPWRRTKEPYHIFVAEFLLQQTDAPRVVPVYEALIAQYPTLESLADSSDNKIAKILQPLGFHFRARRLKQAAKVLVDSPHGQLPDSEKSLMLLPGVGRYTARSICANAFDQAAAVVDTNVARIFERFFGFRSARARSRNDPSLWELAQAAAPKRNVSKWNLSLLDLGAAVCTSRNPKHLECPLRSRCREYRKQT